MYSVFYVIIIVVQPVRREDDAGAERGRHMQHRDIDSRAPRGTVRVQPPHCPTRAPFTRTVFQTGIRFSKRRRGRAPNPSRASASTRFDLNYNRTVQTQHARAQPKLKRAKLHAMGVAQRRKQTPRPMPRPRGYAACPARVQSDPGRDFSRPAGCLPPAAFDAAALDAFFAACASFLPFISIVLMSCSVTDRTHPAAAVQGSGARLRSQTAVAAEARARPSGKRPAATAARSARTEPN